MEPLGITLDTMQGNSASLGNVLPAIDQLQKHFKRIIEENSLKYCLPLAKFVLWDLNKRTADLFMDKDYILGKSIFFL